MLVELKNILGIIYFYFSSVQGNDIADDVQLLIFVLFSISLHVYSLFLFKEEYIMALC